MIKARRSTDLSDEECYLVAILLDLSGLDIAEFVWHEPRRVEAGQIDDGCYRAHHYQWMWWRERSARSIDQMARSLGKSESINVRAHAFPFNYPGQEMVIVAPEHTHVDAIAERIEQRLLGSRLMREMLVKGRSGINHRPFKVLFANGAKIFSRLPQRDGKGIKGIHPVALEADEAQDLQEAAWKEMVPVVRWDVPGAYWRCHGVSKGLRDSFYAKTQPNSGFTVLRMTAMSRPNWSSDEREQMIKDYGGSAFSPDFKRNVYGEHGDAVNRIFMLHRLLRCQVRYDETPTHPYLDEYRKQVIIGAEVEARVGTVLDASTPEHTSVLLDMLDLSVQHVQTYDKFWVGMDVGLVDDPSEILVFAEYDPSVAERKRDVSLKISVPPEGVSRMKLLTRVTLRGLPTPLQADVVCAIIEHYAPQAFSMDSTGLGLPLLQLLQQRAGVDRFAVVDVDENPEGASRALTTIKGYKFNQKVFAGVDERLVDELGLSDPQDILREAGIQRVAKDWATDVLRDEWVDSERLMFPDDDDILNDFNGQTWQATKDPVDAYGNSRRVYGGVGGFHILDAARMAALGWRQGKIEEYASRKQTQTSFPIWLG